MWPARSETRMGLSIAPTIPRSEEIGNAVGNDASGLAGATTRPLIKQIHPGILPSGKYFPYPRLMDGRTQS